MTLRARALAFVLALLGAPDRQASVQAPAAPASAAIAADARAEVLRVVDGDTLEVLLDGERRTLRLESVDTEEKISGRADSSPSKPQTVFGQETATWTRELFAALGERPEIGLVFPGGRRDDAFGRLLCHVILPDGCDFNLLLVAEGKSPYFNKYGNSLVAHEAFVRAQAAARERSLGIWNPATNRAKTPGLPSAVRPYERLLPWWDARAAAIDGFRERATREPERVIAADDAQALARALRSSQDHPPEQPGERVLVFCAVERFFEERDGSLTARMQGEGEHGHLRFSLSRDERGGELERFLRASTAEFRQNYLWAEGTLAREERGVVLLAPGRSSWRTAEPAYPRESSSKR